VCQLCHVLELLDLEAAAGRVDGLNDHLRSDPLEARAFERVYALTIAAVEAAMKLAVDGNGVPVCPRVPGRPAVEADLRGADGRGQVNASGVHPNEEIDLL